MLCQCLPQLARGAAVRKGDMTDHITVAVEYEHTRDRKHLTIGQLEPTRKCKYPSVFVKITDLLEEPIRMWASDDESDVALRQLRNIVTSQYGCDLRTFEP